MRIYGPEHGNNCTFFRFNFDEEILFWIWIRFGSEFSNRLAPDKENTGTYIQIQ
jgi:hypothetical protein